MLNSDFTIAIVNSEASEWMSGNALPTSDHGVSGSNPAGGEILSEPKRRFTAQSPSCSCFRRPNMTEILLKKDVKHKTIHPSVVNSFYLSIYHFDFA